MNIILIIVAAISFVVLAKYCMNPNNDSKYEEYLENEHKNKNVM
jgi:hypothetical protein